MRQVRSCSCSGAIRNSVWPIGKPGAGVAACDFFLRPLRELFVEAAELEEEALTALRNTWRPFDSEVYRTVEQERIDTKRLRRQVESKTS